ncbi:MAG TPA: hypothetical protein VH678_10395 [Xanthobacteraceae bacterium]|jgi:hypothetical protein
MKAVLFAALIFAAASTSGIAQRMSEHSCTPFNCTADSGATAGEMVNHNGKGDRLPVVQVLHRPPAKQPVTIETVRALPRDQELAEGCEPLASSLSRSSLASIAGRCLS